MHILTKGRAGPGFHRVLSPAILLNGVLVASLALRCTSSSSPNKAVSPSPSPGPSSTAPPPCGQTNDGMIHLPPSYDSFTPPPKGGSYVDPIFGCTIVRLTDASQTGSAQHHYYSTLSPISADDSKILIVNEGGSWYVTDLRGNIVVPISNMPASNRGTLLWDAHDGNTFYYANRNSLMKASITGNRVTTSKVHTFPEHQVVVLPDKTDLSIDGQSFAMWGGTKTGTDPLNIFTYNTQTEARKTPYVTSCKQDASLNQGSCVHGITQTADDNVIIGFANDGICLECGNRLWTGLNLIPVQNATNHLDTGYDLSGNSTFIAVNNAATLAGIINACPSGWGLDVRPLANLPSGVCLLDNQPNWHVSYRGNSSQPWVALSFFDTRTKGPELFTNDASYQVPSPSNWLLFEDEIILVRIDANNNNSLIRRLAHARSRSVKSFWAQPRAAISRHGKFVVFDSNMAYAQSGCPAGIVDCSDVFLIKLPQEQHSGTGFGEPRINSVGKERAHVDN